MERNGLAVLLECDDRIGISWRLIDAAVSHVSRHKALRDIAEDLGLAFRRLAFLGRQAGREALAHAVRWHLAHRILVDGPRTVIFP